MSSVTEMDMSSCCSLVYMYIYIDRPLKAELIVHYDNSVHMSHVTLST